MSKEVENRLRKDVEALASLGPRSLKQRDALDAASDQIKKWVAEFGYDEVIESYRINGALCENILAHNSGFSMDFPYYLIGAHYDSHPETPGADDNLSAVAIMNELMRRFRWHPHVKRLRWAYFVNEEPPWFHSENMGSYVVASRIKEQMDSLVGMICLESLGLYFDEPKVSPQPLPFAVDPKILSMMRRADFVGLVYTDQSQRIAQTIEKNFIGSAAPPLEAANLPMAEYSDHWSFWEHGFPAVMLTDTAMYRSPYYHRPDDTPEKLDYGAMAAITDALERSIGELIK
jgi:hypothetical protein